ncbi:hypothetical protein, partial [Escherichia coli]|uniref:hypothetical protein n=1 Tax=Escherichia coli TaxID=562 RepID=UPI003CE4727D
MATSINVDKVAAIRRVVEFLLRVKKNPRIGNARTVARPDSKAASSSGLAQSNPHPGLLSKAVMMRMTIAA